MMIAMISDFTGYLFSSKDRAYIDVKDIMIVLLKLVLETTFHQNVSLTLSWYTICFHI